MSFDPTQFLDTQFTEATDTRSLQIPEATYPALIEKVALRIGEIKKGERAGEQFVALDVTYDLDDADLKAKFDRSKITVKQGIMLDMKSIDPFVIDFGAFKNKNLGLLREAVGLNAPGQPFSFSMLNGRPVKVQ